MQQFIQYASHHYGLLTLAVAAAVAVFIYEAWLRQTHAAALAPQDVVRLMNQGAPVFDIRNPEAFASGHINGARSLSPDQLAKAGETFKRYLNRPVVVCAETAAPAAAGARLLTRQGFSQAFALRGGLAAWRTENLPLTRG